MSGAPGIAHLTEAQLSDLADGTLVGAERVRAEAHLELCEQCRRELAETRALLVEARQARVGVPAPPELWPLVAGSTIYAERMRQQVVRSMRGTLVGGALVLVAATAIITAVAVGWLRPEAAAPTREPPTRVPRAEREGGIAPTPPRAPSPPAPPRPDR